MDFATYSCLKYILMPKIKIFLEFEGAKNPFWHSPVKHSYLVGSWKLRKFSFDINLNGTWERQEQPPLDSQMHLGISPSRFWELWGFIQVSCIMILTSKGMVKRMIIYSLMFQTGNMYDLFWNSRTFSWCQSQINECEKTIITRF